MELIEEYDKIDYDDFKKIKYDQRYPDSIAFIGNINEIFSIDFKNEEVADIHNLIINWDKEGDYNNLGAAQWSIFYNNILRILKKNNIEVTDSIPHMYFHTNLFLR